MFQRRYTAYHAVELPISNHFSCCNPADRPAMLREVCMDGYLSADNPILRGSANRFVRSPPRWQWEPTSNLWRHAGRGHWPYTEFVMPLRQKLFYTILAYSLSYLVDWNCTFIVTYIRVTLCYLNWTEPQTVLFVVTMFHLNMPMMSCPISTAPLHDEMWRKPQELAKYHLYYVNNSNFLRALVQNLPRFIMRIQNVP